MGIETALAGAAQFTVVNRNTSVGETLAKLIQEKTNVRRRSSRGKETTPRPRHRGADQLTSIGLNDETGRVPVDFTTVAPECVVADVVFNPAETLFLKAAKARGCRALSTASACSSIKERLRSNAGTGVDPDTGVIARRG